MPSRNFYLNSIHQQRCTDGNLMLGNVRCRYPEVVPFMIPPNLLLPNLQHSPEYKASPSTANIAINSNIRIIGASPMSRPVTVTISFRWKLLTNG